MATKRSSAKGRTGRSQAGAKGGRTTASRRGRAHYSEIGRKGGSSRGRRASMQA